MQTLVKYSHVHEPRVKPRIFSRSPVVRCLFKGTSTSLKPLRFPQCLGIRRADDGQATWDPRHPMVSAGMSNTECHESTTCVHHVADSVWYVCCVSIQKSLNKKVKSVHKACAKYRPQNCFFPHSQGITYHR